MDMTSCSRIVATTAALALAAATTADAQERTRTPRPRPDLLISAVTVTSPLGARACIGNANTVTVTLRNDGYATSTLFKVAAGYYEPEAGKVVASVGQAGVSGLARGATTRVTFTGVTGSETTGTPFAHVMVDADADVRESDEANNYYRRVPALNRLPARDRCPLTRTTAPRR